MNKAAEFKLKAEHVLKERESNKQEDKKILDKAVSYFIDHIANKASEGLFSCETSNIVKMIDGRFFCQTESGGDGFYMGDIDLFLKALENEGFTVKLSDRNKGGYIKLFVSWL